LPASSSPADDTVAPPVVVRPSSDGAGLPPFRPVVDSVVPTPLRHEVDDEPLTAPSTDAGVGAWSQFDAYRSPEQLSVAQVHSAEHGPRLAPRDPRGAAAALASLVLFGLTFLDWYAITLTFAAGRALQGRATVYQVGYRGWYLVIPGVAVLGVVVGVLNFLLRVTDDWAVTVFVALRLLAVAAVVLMALALVFVHPYDLTSVAGDASTATAVPLTVHVSRLWPACSTWSRSRCTATCSSAWRWPATPGWTPASPPPSRRPRRRARRRSRAWPCALPPSPARVTAP
jgi:hypothetical protein